MCKYKIKQYHSFASDDDVDKLSIFATLWLQLISKKIHYKITKRICIVLGVLSEHDLCK